TAADHLSPLPAGADVPAGHPPAGRRPVSEHLRPPCKTASTRPSRTDVPVVAMRHGRLFRIHRACGVGSFAESTWEADVSLVWNVFLGGNQRCASDLNDPLIRCAHGILQRSASELVGNVHSDHGERAVIQRKDIWGATYRSRVATESRGCAEAGDRFHGDLQRRGEWYR